MPIRSLFRTEGSEILAALGRSQAVIEFDLKGIILGANENFCSAVGYSLDEIVGQHHRMFVSVDYAVSTEYKEFWRRLASGEFFTAEYQRFGKGGREIWIEASYNPVFRHGKPQKIIKFATDITERKRQNLENSGKLAALSRAQAIIEFLPDGTILTANENFLHAVGYRLEEIVGKHHSIFCDPKVYTSLEYTQLWRICGVACSDLVSLPVCAKTGQICISRRPTTRSSTARVMSLRW